MKKYVVCLPIVAAALFGLITAANAWPLEVYQIPDPIQDEWTVPPWMHELGNFPFPPEQLIESSTVPWEGHIPCLAEYRGLGAVQVRMRNLTPWNYPNVFYVADTPETQLSNWDEWLGQVGFAPGQSFKIDAVGENTPLVFESMVWDGIWQSGEVWEFVIQEYNSAWGGAPSAFASVGLIGGGSLGDFLSTGSILVPEPSCAALIALGGLAFLWARRRCH